MTPTGFRDPNLIYRGLLYVNVYGLNHQTRVYAKSHIHGGTVGVDLLNVPRHELVTYWEAVERLIRQASAMECRSCDGVPWEIHLIQDRTLWYRATDAWRVSQS